MRNPVPPSDIYLTNPDWLPDPSLDRSREYVQEVLYEEDPEVKINGESLNDKIRRC